jgi:beta-glucosidase
MVLLKNNGGLLPLDAAKIRTIAVIGDNAQRAFSIGGGSAQIKAPYEVTALDGIKARAGAGITVSYARGYVAAGGGGRGRRGGPPAAGAGAAPDTAALAAEAVTAAKAADVVIYVGGLTHEAGDAESGDRADLRLPFGQDALLAQVLAANPRTVVVLNGGGALEMPWVDQANAILYAWYGGLENGNAMASLLFGDASPSGKLPSTFPKKLEDTPTYAGGQDAYPGLPNPDAPRRGGGPGAFPGGPGQGPAAAPPPAVAGAAPAVVAAAAPGQASAAPGAAPGPGGGARGARGARGAGGPGGGNGLIPSTVQHYSEKLLVGYRWYDTKKIEPLFPFGHGLSYTTFAYSNLRVSPGGADGALATVQFDVTNTGTREAAEVAQLYVHQDKPALERPEKELKGFQKITLKPGERQTVRLALKAGAFAYYDPEKKSWIAEAGVYQLLAGSSSRDVPLRAAFNLTQAVMFKD